MWTHKFERWIKGSAKTTQPCIYGLTDCITRMTSYDLRIYF